MFVNTDMLGDMSFLEFMSEPIPPTQVEEAPSMEGIEEYMPDPTDPGLVLYSRLLELGLPLQQAFIIGYNFHGCLSLEMGQKEFMDTLQKITDGMNQAPTIN